MEEFDGSFIQAIKHKPKLTITKAECIPLINLSVPNTQILVTQIGDACKNWGFFQVINHGVFLELRENVEVAAKKFFAQPKEEKLKVKRNEMNPFGYYDTEHTKNVKDWKELFGFTIEDVMVIPASDPDDKELKHFVNQWPENLKI